MGAIALELKGCENCRQGFLRKNTSVQVFCNRCRQMYQEDSNQLWGCVECGTERKWGDRLPDKAETRGKRLYCCHCATVTEHAYSRMSPRMQQ
jgi:hypothetical protein